MGKYATISVPREVKEALKKAKGRQEWGKFLLNLYQERRRLKSKRAFEQLTSTLTEEDLETILESSEEFRKRFTLR